MMILNSTKENSKLRFVTIWFFFYLILCVAEQRVKVPSAHCDSRVRTVCADVVSLLKGQARALSPQV